MHWGMAGSVCPQGSAGVSGHWGLVGVSEVHWGDGRECRDSGACRGIGGIGGL